MQGQINMFVKSRKFERLLELDKGRTCENEEVEYNRRSFLTPASSFFELIFYTGRTWYW